MYIVIYPLFHQKFMNNRGGTNAKTTSSRQLARIDVLHCWTVSFISRILFIRAVHLFSYWRCIMILTANIKSDAIAHYMTAN